MRSSSRHGLFFRYLIMFLLVLTVPAGLMGASIWGSMRAALWKEIESSMQAASQQVVSVLEQYMVGMDALAAMLVTDTDVRTMTAMMANDRAAIEKSEGVRKMNAYKTPNAFIERIMVANGKHILSSEGLLMEQEELAIAQILREVKNGQFAYRPDLMHDKIYYVRRLSILRDSGQFLLCEIPRSIFARLAGALPHAPHVHMILVEGAQNVVFSSVEEVYPFIQDAVEGQWRHLSSDGRAFLLYATRIERMNLRAFFVLPEDVVGAPLTQTLQVLAVYMLLAVLLGIGLSLWFAYRNYKPLQPLLNEIGHVERGVHRCGGLKSISDAYDRTIRDNMQLKERVMRQQVYTARHFMLGVLRGRYSSDIDLVQMASQFNISFAGSHFRVLLVLAHRCASQNWDSRDDEAIQALIGRAFMDRCQVSMLTIEPGCTAVVLNYGPSQMPEDAILLATEEILSTIRHRFGVGVTIGLSEEQECLSALHKAYVQAENACEYRLIRGHNRVIPAREVEGLIDDVSLRYVQAFRNQSDIQRHLEDGNFGAIEMHINRLFAEIANSGLSVSLARCLYYEIINMVLRTVSYGFIKTIDVSRLLEVETMEELREGALDIYRKACRERQLQKVRKGPAENALEYIRTHYMQPNLSLESVAGALGISRSYLSRLFSERMSMSFSEYVGRLRIAEACALMSDTELTVAQIAALAGYQDLHTFLRNFKKYVGMTPTQYRERKADADRRPQEEKNDHP